MFACGYIVFQFQRDTQELNFVTYASIYIAHEWEGMTYEVVATRGCRQNGR